MPEPSRLTAVLAIGAYNLVQNLLLPDRAYVPANLTVSCGLVALARRQGCTWDDLGLDLSRAGTGLRLGMVGAGAATAVAAAAGIHPATRRYLLDRRVAGQRGHEVAYRTLVRFPLGTALFEELAFRGVIYGMWRRSGASNAAASLAAAATFGIWHIIPANQALNANPLTAGFSSRQSRAEVVVAGTIITSLASLAFTWMREQSGSLIAPWITHSAINGTTYLAGVAAWRRSARHG